LSIHGSSLKDYYYFDFEARASKIYYSQARVLYSSLLLYDIEARAFMARASKIFIILRLEYYALAYYYMTLRLERSWLEPQRFLLLSGSSIIL
jgi:hypothetical protein